MIDKKNPTTAASTVPDTASLFLLCPFVSCTGMDVCRCSCACMITVPCGGAHACRGLRLTLSIVPNHSPQHLSRRSLATECRAPSPTRLANQLSWGSPEQVLAVAGTPVVLVWGGMAQACYDWENVARVNGSGGVSGSHFWLYLHKPL